MKRKDGLYQRKPGGPYYASAKWKGRRVCESTGFTQRTLAKGFLDKMKVGLRDGTYRTPTERRKETARASTVGKLADKWLSIYVEVNRKEKDRATAKYRVQHYLKAFMGDLPAAATTKDTLREYRVYLEALTETVTGEDGKEKETPRLTAQTVAHVLSDVRCLLFWAHDMGHIAHLPVPKKLLPTIGEREPRGLSRGEQRQVSAVEGSLGLACRIMIGTGVRWSELCRLTSAELSGGEVVVQGETKSKKMRRIPVPPALLKELRSHVGKLIPFEQDYNPTFNRSIQRASGVEDFGAHRCRHSFALNYVRDGGNIRVLQMLMGHASLETTEIYLRISQQTVREDAKKTMGWTATA